MQPLSTGILPRLTLGPAAVSRAARRITQGAVFFLDALAASEAPPSDACHSARRIGWIAENVAALHGVQTFVRGPRPQGPCVIVGNHLGYLDPTALLCVAPAIPIGKRELGAWPVIGDLMAKHHVLLVDRDDPYSGAVVLRRALKLLREGASVLTFPEGTTTRGDRVLPFRRGIFGVAQRAGVPVVPVAVRYECSELCWVGNSYFLPHYLRSASQPAMRVELTFGSPVDGARFESAAGLAEHCRAWVADAIR